MIGERRIRILSQLIGETTPELETSRLCRVCADITGVSGAGIMLMSDDLPRGSVCTTDEVSALIEELQARLGEGPCVDACVGGQSVLEPDLAAPETLRWPAFTGPAVDAGARAVFGFPLRVGGARLGALNLYCDRPGALTHDQHADALVMADVVAQTVLVMQSNAPAGSLAAELESGGDFQCTLHQASGMVAAQLDASVSHALIRLRAYAFGHDRSLAEVADAVVARTLRFTGGSA